MAASERPLWYRLLWFILLWGVGVVAVAGVAYGLRLWIA
jgi:hypothetical protein